MKTRQTFDEALLSELTIKIFGQYFGCPVVVKPWSSEYVLKATLAPLLHIGKICGISNYTSSKLYVNVGKTEMGNNQIMLTKFQTSDLLLYLKNTEYTLVDDALHVAR